MFWGWGLSWKGTFLTEILRLLVLVQHPLTRLSRDLHEHCYSSTKLTLHFYQLIITLQTFGHRAIYIHIRRRGSKSVLGADYRYLCGHGVRELLHAGAEVHPLQGRCLVRESRELLHQHEVHEHSLLNHRVPHLHTHIQQHHSIFCVPRVVRKDCSIVSLKTRLTTLLETRAVL